jgi:hypothetical protein
MARQGVLAADRQAHHRRVPGQHPGVVRGQERPPVGRDVLHPGGLHAPPAVVQESEQGLDETHELLVEAPLVLGVVARQPPQRDPYLLARPRREDVRRVRERVRKLRAAVEPLAQAEYE